MTTTPRPAPATLADLHWLIFNARCEVVGCHCGFEADLEGDFGWGDSVVKHLLAVGAKSGGAS